MDDGKNKPVRTKSMSDHPEKTSVSSGARRSPLHTPIHSPALPQGGLVGATSTTPIVTSPLSVLPKTPGADKIMSMPNVSAPTLAIPETNGARAIGAALAGATAAGRKRSGSLDAPSAATVTRGGTTSPLLCNSAYSPHPGSSSPGGYFDSNHNLSVRTLSTPASPNDNASVHPVTPQTVPATNNSNTVRPKSPSRQPSNTYAPARHPSQNNQRGTRKTSQGAVPSVSGSKPSSNAQYYAQERAYLQKMRNNLADDYYTKGIPASDLDRSSDEESLSEFEGDFVGLGGVGTFFDDSGAISYPFLEAKYNADDAEKSESIRERLQWQSMLTSVLTGEVVKNEKQRLRAPPEMDKKLVAEELWMGVRAKVCGRSMDEQRRIIEYSRNTKDGILLEVVNFRAKPADEAGGRSASDQVEDLLNRLDNFEQLWRSYSLIETDKPFYGSQEFQERLTALLTWSSLTWNIGTEIRLLQQWIGNEDIDLTRPAEGNDMMADKSPFIERLLKGQDLKNIFENRVLGPLSQLVDRARTSALEYHDTFQTLGLPVLYDHIGSLARFPSLLIMEVMRTRLNYARKLANPTMMMIDQTMVDIRGYIELSLKAKERYMFFVSPTQDGPWPLKDTIGDAFDETLIDCVSFYFDLLSRKFLESSNAVFRTFKEGEQLEFQYKFLSKIGEWISGGDYLVAEQFSYLTSKLMTKLLDYWQDSLKGPASDQANEIAAFYSETAEQIRSFERNLIRFYTSMCSSYENASEYAIQPSRLGAIVNSVRRANYFLVYTGVLERDGIYVFADPSLRERPHKLKEIIRGYSRYRRPEEDSVEYDHIAHVLILCSEEPFIWEGEILNIDMPSFDLEIKMGRMRIVSEGGTHMLQLAKTQFAEVCEREFLNTVVEAKSNQLRVDHEFGRLRKLFFRLSMSVIDNVATIRHTLKGLGCQDTVQNMFVFAREFGQRGLRSLEGPKRGYVTMKLINLCIEWVSFVVDDCTSTEYRTFRYTVTALEFASVMTSGVNILAVNEEAFLRLRVKVAGCMSLLISHFDIMGARSKAKAQQKVEVTSARRKKISHMSFKDDTELMEAFRNDAVKKLEDLERKRNDLEFEHHYVGRVLDDGSADDQFLMSLASAFSNVTMRWQLGRFIGSGTFGDVYSALNLDNGEMMAVKEIRLQDAQSIRTIVKAIKDEMTVLEMLHHPNIVQYFGVEVHRDRVYLFMEICQGGSIADLLSHGRIEDEQVIQVYTFQMLQGLAYLHHAGIVHRDLKPENILLDHNGLIKFVDFGAAKVIARNGRTRAAQTGTRSKINSLTGTPMYMSPEVITGSNPGRQGAIDIWSLGCVVLEMATGRRPWSNLDNEYAIMFHIASGHMPQLPSAEQLSPEGQAFLLKCLDRDPNKRESAIELSNDPWLARVKNDHLEQLTPMGEE
ncbi:hypothetical protein B0I72DRAFT_132570 [Yarrowia lipolytica]|nr:hypothetical protein YALI1_A05335g [Yarrowia lipolytica]KAB8284164.1 hypothetical protein BKA91DRAFT_135408 [Yarrowia lipolytica]KAE8173077.1 hypothetical protein BKA90DRAFT_136206 [Yarrowia lipolytica]QNP95607.1 MAP kinase kinase kinase wis4 [Yarrowia lipolytica]RDW25122.1 hypothetical protein B0I71DRAFT_133172 [Yarrowia lipolytica]